MEGKDSAERGTKSPRLRTIAIALNGGSKSKYIVRWAMEKFVPEGNVALKLFHVFPKISGVPTPMGNLIPLPQVRDDVAAAYKKEVEWQKTEMMVQYQKKFILKKIPAEVVLIESDEIPNAISKEIARYGMKDLVIGASSNSLFARKFKGQLLSSVISECAPSFCTVYVVSKGKLESLRPSNSETNGNVLEYDSSACDSAYSSSRYTNNTFDPESATSESPFASPAIPRNSRKQADTLSSVKSGYINQWRDSSQQACCASIDTRDLDDDNAWSSSPGSYLSRTSSINTTLADCEPWIPYRASTPKYRSFPVGATIRRSDLAAPPVQVNVNLELKKLTTELRHLRGMYAIAQNEKMDPSQRLSDLNKLRHEEAMKEKEKLKNTFAGPTYEYRKYTWEEIVSATSFSEGLKIGKGEYGSLYKCKLHDKTVAIKVLHSKEGTQNKQFHQELEILSKIRHSHLLLLLGACPEKGCLVYEYMENGSLGDHLFRKNHTPPIPWFDRFRIAWEVASALAFLHNNKPKSITHQDLKPANILLDHSFVSKIGDVGIRTMLNSYKDSNPEDEHTVLISMKSDVYALGMVILQLLTAKPAAGLVQMVEHATSEGRLMDILDEDAGRWPVRETAQMGLLGMQCVGLIKGRDRPDLREEVVPTLEMLKDVAEEARVMGFGIQVAPPTPSHFICPILKDVMEDPCVASDGYTYDRKAIEMWLKENDTSPTTNFPLSNKNLLPNYTLIYAILDWKSKRRPRSNHGSSRFK